MKNALTAVTAVAVLALASSAALAQGQTISFQLGDVAAKLHDEPCQNTTVQQLIPPNGPEFHAADIVWQGKPLAACWAIVGSQIIVVDETGDSGFLSPAGFRHGETPV